MACISGTGHSREVRVKDGQYTMVFSADGHTSDGRLHFSEGRASGGDGSYRLNGQIAEAGRNLIGVIQVELAPGMSPNAKIAEAFEVRMHGKADDAGFTLIGAGPLGIIVELTCSYDAPSAT